MKTPTPSRFSRRERQIMDIVYHLDSATAADVHRRMPDAPTYTTVRGLLRILVKKGHLTVSQDGPRFVYRPRTPRQDAGASVLAHVVHTFFSGSAASAMAAMLGSADVKVTPSELERLTRMVRRARATHEET
jgi:predicted transcriptional regulator